MAKKEKIVLTSAQRAIGIAMDNAASAMATVLAPQVQGDIDRLITARQEWEGGKFTVMFRLTRSMSAEQLAAAPNPKAKEGNNPATYFSAKIVDGKEQVKEHYFYEVMALAFPVNVAKGRRIDQLKRSMMDPSKVNTSDIGKDILDMSHNYRGGEITRLTKEISSSVSSVVGAFELRHQLLRFEELPHVTVELLFKIGPEGLPLNGEDGRDMVIDPTQTPIIVRSNIKGRETVDNVRVGVSTFLKYDVDKAKEQHGTWQAVMDTVKRAKATDEQGQGQANSQTATQLIRTTDTALARILDLHEFSDYALDEKDGKLLDAMRKATHGDGTDEAFTSCFALKNFLNDVCGSPRDQARYDELIKAERKAAA